MPVNQLCLCAVEEMTCQENERENSNLTSVSNGVPSKKSNLKKILDDTEVEIVEIIFRDENSESTLKSCSALLQM